MLFNLLNPFMYSNMDLTNKCLTTNYMHYIYMYIYVM